MKYLKLFENMGVEEAIEFLWDFFIDIEDDGLDIDIKEYSTEDHPFSIRFVTKAVKKLSIIDISIMDPNEVYGHVYVSLEHKKPIADILKRLESIGIKPLIIDYHRQDKKLKLRFRAKDITPKYPQ